MKISRKLSYAVVLAVSLWALGCASSGTQRTDNFNKKVAETKTRVDKASEQVDMVLAAMNGLMSEGVDLPKQYKSYCEQIKKVENGIKESQNRQQAMQKESTVQIQAWEKQLSQIESKDMRTRSEDRLNDVKKQRDELNAKIEAVSQSIGPFMTGLKDIKNYLDVDLSPSSVKSINDLISQTGKDGQKVKDSLAALSKTLAGIKGEEASMQ